MKKYLFIISFILLFTGCSRIKNNAPKDCIREFERHGVDCNSSESASSNTKEVQKLLFTTLTEPKKIAEEASVLEKKLKKLAMVTDAAVYDYDDNHRTDITSFDVELILKNGDRIKLCGVKSDLTFFKNRNAGIRQINEGEFFYSRLFEGTWPRIPCMDLASALGKKNFVDVEFFLNDYDIIKAFLLFTPFGFKTGFFSNEMTFYNYKGTDFMRN